MTINKYDSREFEIKNIVDESRTKNTKFVEMNLDCNKSTTHFTVILSHNSYEQNDKSKEITMGFDIECPRVLKPMSTVYYGIVMEVVKSYFSGDLVPSYSMLESTVENSTNTIKKIYENEERINITIDEIKDLMKIVADTIFSELNKIYYEELIAPKTNENQKAFQSKY